MSTGRPAVRASACSAAGTTNEQLRWDKAARTDTVRVSVGVRWGSPRTRGSHAHSQTDSNRVKVHTHTGAAQQKALDGIGAAPHKVGQHAI
jgi:hypothetical protein